MVNKNDSINLYKCIKNGRFNVFERISKKKTNIDDKIIIVFSAEDYELNEYVIIDTFVLENFTFIITKNENPNIDLSDVDYYTGKFALSELEKIINI